MAAQRRRPASFGATRRQDADAAPAVPLASAFLTSADRLAGCPADAVPEAAFVGRSNAGKSSVLNRLAGRKRLARVSKTPGRTQLINFFAVAGGGRLVDLPGYGYARAPAARRQAWGEAVDDYLRHRTNLVCLVLVMDARHPLQPFDRTMLEWCGERGLPLLALLNKADKIKRAAAGQALAAVRGELPDGAAAMLFSAASGLGAAAAAAFLRERLGGVESPA